MIDVVVARYQEDVSWVDRLPSKCRVTIYNKGASNTIVKTRIADIKHLPNVGREAHSYLYHILNVIPFDPYPALHTVFCQGNPFDHCPEFEAMLALDLPLNGLNNFVSLGHHCECDANGMPQHQLEIGLTYQQIMLQRPLPTYRFIVGAQFIVNNDLFKNPDVLARCRRAMELVDKDRGATIGGKNDGLTWGAHCLERLWSYILTGGAP